MHGRYDANNTADMMFLISGARALVCTLVRVPGRGEATMQELHRQVTAVAACETALVAAGTRTLQAWRRCDGSGGAEGA